MRKAKTGYQRLLWVIPLVASLMYLSNLGVGIIEVVPDNIPVTGNVDEFIASLILIKSLEMLGIRRAGK